MNRRQRYAGRFYPALVGLVLLIFPGFVSVPRGHAHDQPLSAPIILSGPMKIAMCDSGVCPLPGEGDPGWTLLYLEPDGLKHPLPHHEGVGWVSLSFTVQGVSEFRNPAVLITHPPDAEEVFLNGTPIGGAGRLADYFTVHPSSPKIMIIPPSSLREGENRLLVKALFAGINARVFDGPILLGDHPVILAEAERMRQPIIATEASLLSVFLLLLVFYGFLLAQRVFRPEYLLFFAFLGFYTISFVLGSHLFSLSGISSPWVTRGQSVLSALLVIIMIGLVTTSTQSRKGLLFFSLLAVGFIFMVLDAFLPPLKALYMLSAPRKYFLAAVGIFYLFMSIRAVLSRREESIPILLGVLIYVTGSRMEIFWGINMRDTALGAFAICLLFALSSRHARLRNRITEISTKLIDAHEEERRRIARDIHDTVGQSLLALKMHLQMIASKFTGGVSIPAENLEVLIKDTSSIIEDVHRASMDLRPSFIDSMSLTEAMNWYADSLRQHHRIAIHVHNGADLPLNMQSRVKDNLYRIFQEILTNALKHSQAARVDADLYRSGRKTVLQVTDNGCGFDASAKPRTGMGLSTMRERAELLGGVLAIRSAPGRGTSVIVEIPDR